MTSNLPASRQIVRNHQAKIRWGSEAKAGSKSSVTDEVDRLPEPTQKHSRMGPVLFNASARLPRSKITHEEIA